MTIELDGRILTITNLYDINGEETYDIAEAVCVVAKESDNSWWTIPIEDLEPVTLH